MFSMIQIAIGILSVLDVALLLAVGGSSPHTASPGSMGIDSVFSHQSICFIASLPPIQDALKIGQRPLLIVNDSNTGWRISLPRDCATPQRPAELRSLEYLIPDAAMRVYAKEGKEGVVRIRWGPRVKT